MIFLFFLFFLRFLVNIIYKLLFRITAVNEAVTTLNSDLTEINEVKYIGYWNNGTTASLFSIAPYNLYTVQNIILIPRRSSDSKRAHPTIIPAWCLVGNMFSGTDGMTIFYPMSSEIPTPYTGNLGFVLSQYGQDQFYIKSLNWGCDIYVQL